MEIGSGDMRRFRGGRSSAPHRPGLLAGIAALALVAGAALILSQRSGATLTEVLQTTCDVGGTDTGLVLPLDLLRAGTPNLPVRIGPLDSPAAEVGISLEFRPGDGSAEGVRRRGDVISLPLLLDGQGRVPNRVVLSCREGRVATVRYEWKDGSRQELPVPARP